LHKLFGAQGVLFANELPFLRWSLPPAPVALLSRCMSDSAYRVRRAIIDDLETLRDLWATNHLPAEDLDKRLKECQVVEGPDGTLLGALAMEINGRSGRLHSEAFADFARADEMRHALWERMQSVGTNHGLARYWTQEPAPFWRNNGFQAPDEAAMKKLAEQWAAIQGPWITLRVRDEEALEKSLDKEFARFKEETKRQTDRAMAPGRTMKTAATIIAIILAIAVFVASIYVMMNQFGMRR
jgi:hypothetical protein